MKTNGRRDTFCGSQEDPYISHLVEIIDGLGAIGRTLKVNIHVDATRKDIFACKNAYITIQLICFHKKAYAF
jgi:hypothetical protein